MADKFQFEVEVTGNGEAKVRALTSAVEEFGKASQDSLGRATGAFEVFKGVLGAEAVKAGFEALIGLGEKLFDEVLVGGVEAAIKTEDAINRLNQSLVASGKYSESASAELVRFAGALQQTTKYGDDATLSAAAFLQSVTRLDTEGLKKAVVSAQDLASGLGIDLQGASNQLAGAIEGHAGRLAKYGLVLKEGATQAENFAAVQAFVQNRFGGAAAAEVNTFSGSVTVLGAAYEDAKKEIGFAVIQNQTLINVLKEGAKILSEFTEGNSDLRDAMSSFVTDGVLLAIEALDLLLAGVQQSIVAAYKMAEAYYLAEAAVGTVAEAIPVLNQFTKSSKESADAAVQMGLKVQELESGNTTLDKMRGALDRVRTAAQQGVGQVADTANLATRSLQNASQATEEFTAAQLKLAEEGKRVADTLIKKDPSEEYRRQSEALLAARDLDRITEEEYTLAVAQAYEQMHNKKSEQLAQYGEQLVQQNAALLTDINANNLAQVESNNKKLQQIAQSEVLNAKDRAKVQQQSAEQSKKIEELRTQAMKDSLGNLASFQNAKTKEIAFIGKAAAIAQTTISTYEGATKAAAALSGIPIVGPALGAAAAATFIAAGIANVARISGVDLATGISEVPPGFPNDSFPANLTSGERVVDSGTNQDLKLFLVSASQMVPLLQAILATLQNQRMALVVNIGSKTIMNEVIEGIQNGREIAI